MNPGLASRLLSQIFDRNSTSIYETMRELDEASLSQSEMKDLEHHAGMCPNREYTHPEESSRRARSSYEFPDRSHYDTSSTTPDFNKHNFETSTLPSSNQTGHASTPFRQDYYNIEVPESLLFEPERETYKNSTRMTMNTDQTLGGINCNVENQSPSLALNHRSVHNITWNEPSWMNYRSVDRGQLGLIDPKERALWKWANVENLDNFLYDVYMYFAGKGIYNILLSRLLNLMTLIFVIVFSSFLGLCVDYKKIPAKRSLRDVTIPHCMTRTPAKIIFLLWCISLFCIYKLISYVMDLRRLWDIHNFYIYLLEIPDSDMQTVSWQEIVGRLMVLRDANPNTADNVKRRDYTNLSKQRMDAHDIANRLMRRENYLIALCNKDILDLSVPLPFLRYRGNMMTRTMEWTLSQCILDFVFNEHGQFRTLFLKDTYRKSLSESLERRFRFAGVMHLIFSPFIVTYFVLLFLLRNLHDFIKTPARMGHRQYTPLAEWKFREFNELWHLFQMRLNMSYPAAEAYVEQFPKEKTAQVARFVSFVASSLLGVLAIGALLDPDLVQGFEILPGLNALVCMGILTPIVAVSRGMLQEENTVYDPEWSLRNVIEHTHYMPATWKDKLHSDDVKRDFMSLYCLKISIFIDEIMSVVLTPLVLWFSLPRCSDRIIDFFREFTVHVDGVGYVCSFAVFNFDKPNRQGTDDLREEYFATKDNKMLASYLGFMDQYRGVPSARGKKRTRLFSPSFAMETNVVSLSKQSPIYQDSKDSTNAFPKESPGLAQSLVMSSSLLDHHHRHPRRNLHKNTQSTLYQTSFRSPLKEQNDNSDHSVRDEETAFPPVLESSFFDTGKCAASPMDDQSSDPGAGVLELLNQFVGAHNGEPGGRGGIV